MILSVTPPKIIVISPAIAERVVSISQVKLVSLIDNGSDELKAIVEINNTTEEFTIYQGEEYLAAIENGNWNRETVFNKIIEKI